MTLTLKKRLINVGVLSAVFIVAVIIFSYVTNKGNDNMTADMGAQHFHRSHFSYGDYKINYTYRLCKEDGCVFYA